jgi:hypothetical protein
MRRPSRGERAGGTPPAGSSGAADTGENLIEAQDIVRIAPMLGQDVEISVKPTRKPHGEMSVVLR